MGCLLVLVALLSPRLALFLMLLFSNILERAFDDTSVIVPILGWFLLPWTTLVFALCFYTDKQISGLEIFLLVAAFCLDLSSYGFGRRHYGSRGRGSAPAQGS